MLSESEDPINVIIDTDMGWDDVMAILYLMKSPNIKILGVTVTGCGETHLKQGVEIAQRLLKLGNVKAPVCPGASEPSQYNHQFPKSFRMDMDTICDQIKYLPEVDEPADPRQAWTFINDTLENEESPIVILSLGGLTNIAKVIEINPEAKLENIERIVIMGGAINAKGNVAALNNSNESFNQGPIYATNNYAEWNIFLDPLAAKEIFHTEIPITLVPLDACNDIILQPVYNTLITANDSIAVFAKRLLKDKTEGDHKEALPLPIFDPLAAMIMSASMKHTSYKSLVLDVKTVDQNLDNRCGEIYITSEEGTRPINVAMGVSENEFQQIWARIFNSPVVIEGNGEILKINLSPLEIDKRKPQVWNGYDPSCTLDNPENCKYYPSNTYNIKMENVYDNIEIADNHWIELACKISKESVEHKGGPFGAVIMQIDSESNEIIRYWTNHNQVTLINDPTAHAEVMTIRSACRSLGVFNLGEIKKEESLLEQPSQLSHCVIFSSTEPCPMCYSAICWAKIPKLFFGATRFDAAVQGVDFSDEEIYEELSMSYSKRKMEVYQCTVENSLDAFNLWKRIPKTNY